MELKYKIREAAKDLNISPAEIVETLKTYLNTEKKPTATLTEEETDIVLEKVSQSNQVKDFNAFFAMRNNIKREAKKAQEEKPKETVKAVKLEKKNIPDSVQNIQETVKSDKVEQPKTVNVKANTNHPRFARFEKTEKQDSSVKQEQVQTDKSAIKTNNNEKAVVKNDTMKPANAKNEQPVNNNGIGKQGDKSAQFAKSPQVQSPQVQNTQTQRPQAQRPQNQNQQNQRPQTQNQNKGQQTRNANQNKLKIVPKPIQAVVDVNKLKVNEPPTSKVKGEAVQRGEQITKRVDTRGSYVELDKYNERYEKISPQGKTVPNDNFNRKQKISQKSQQKRQPFGKQRETEAQKLKRLELERARKQQLKVLIPDEIVVSELASRLKVTANQVIKKLFNLGEMCTINQVIDFDTAALVAEELGAKVEREKIFTIEERLFEEIDDTDDNLLPRSPVVVVMGHVDHGKTSLLDRIRNANVVQGEAGGITQHIGAYRVSAGGKDITFLDTPGHEAFTSMRARGASITDIAILVVAADDGIKPQTVEAINHAKAAGVSIIVAINKIDKEGANIERVKQELTEHELVCEEWGGDIICVPVSAKQGTNIDTLLEMINLTAEMLELKANPDRLAVGTVVEAQLDKGRGPIASVLVQKGTLHTGDIIIAGTSVGRVRVMRDDMGKVIKEAGPSVPVEIMGLAEVPSAGDTFAVVDDEKLARELVDKRKHEAKEEQFSLYQKVTLDNLFAHIEDGTVKELPVIVKADVQGSVEAVRQSLEKLSNKEVRVRVIHGGVGAVSESDVMLGSASNAIIVGFNVRPNPAAADNAKRDGVEIRLYRIIYDAIEEIETAMKGLLAPKYREVEMARIEVRNVFKITGVGAVAGCYVLSGKVARNCEIRVVRDGIVVNVDKIDSLKRFKDDVKEVAQGYECGISLVHFTDIKESDIFEAFITEEYRD